MINLPQFLYQFISSIVSLNSQCISRILKCFFSYTLVSCRNDWSWGGWKQSFIQMVHGTTYNINQSSCIIQYTSINEPIVSKNACVLCDVYISTNRFKVVLKARVHINQWFWTVCYNHKNTAPRTGISQPIISK